MRTLRSVSLLLVALLVLGAGCGQPEAPTAEPPADTLAADAGAGALTIPQAWARPAAEGANSALYLTIAGGAEPDTLVGVMSDAAATVELHESFEQDGMMSMRPVEALPVPANGTVELAPGGYHVMLIGAARALDEGGRVPAILSFARAGDVSVLAEVAQTAPGAAPSAEADASAAPPPAE